MSSHRSDDIDALFSRAGLDASKYRDFSSSRRAKDQAGSPGPIITSVVVEQPSPAIDDSAPTQSSSQTRDVPPTVVPALSTPVDVPHGFGARLQPEPPSSGDSWHSLPRRRARASTSVAARVVVQPAQPQWNARVQRKTASSIRSAEPQRVEAGTPPNSVSSLPHLAAAPRPGTCELPRGSFAVFSLGGGTGKTTVCASVAQCLRITGERLMIADFGDDSLLPIYFGPNRLRSGSLETFLSDDQTNYAPLHLYHDVETADEWSDVGRMLGHLSSQVLALGDNFDRVIVDLPGAAHKTRWPVFQASRTCLVVLAPDFHSVLGAKRLEEIRCQQQAEGRGGVTFYYVLNKFNPTRPFHLEIQRRLDQQLGDLLLPIYIQRSDDIPEALASGCTVFDYSPQAPVVEDFVRLAEWIGTLS